MLAMSRRKRIGIMGGTFDPVHMVHLTLAENAYHSFGLDEVMMLPNGDPPHKMGHQVLGRIAVLLPQLPKAVCRQQIDLRRRDGGHADHDLGVIHQGDAAEQIAGSQVKEGDLISAGTEAEGAELPLDQKACLCGQRTLFQQDLAAAVLASDAVFDKKLPHVGADLDVAGHGASRLLS